jgi:hypothetical protein
MPRDVPHPCETKRGPVTCLRFIITRPFYRWRHFNRETRSEDQRKSVSVETQHPVPPASIEAVTVSRELTGRGGVLHRPGVERLKSLSIRPSRRHCLRQLQRFVTEGGENRFLDQKEPSDRWRLPFRCSIESLFLPNRRNLLSHIGNPSTISGRRLPSSRSKTRIDACILLRRGQIIQGISHAQRLEWRQDCDQDSNRCVRPPDIEIQATGGS